VDRRFTGGELVRAPRARVERRVRDRSLSTR
jgi:hypothetical protein